MASVAVIAEFNPFHNGHALLAKKIRDTLGIDTRIMALMSGSYVQRGDLAVADPYVRAECAVRGGYDLVLALPFPFSAASAELYATAGISLISALGAFDTLAFGCECGDLTRLQRIADASLSPDFSDCLDRARKSEEGKKQGYAYLRRQILASFLSEDDGICLSHPNNILAVEYLRAIRRLGSGLSPLAIHREGADYHAITPEHPSLIGATALRALLNPSGIHELSKYIPAEALSPLKRALEQGNAPARFQQLSDAILAFLISLPDSALPSPEGEPGGLLRRIRSAARDSRDLDGLIRRVSARSFTDSHVRRTILSLWLDSTSFTAEERPSYTRVLGMNESGRELLRGVKGKATVALLTKTADYRALLPDAVFQAERSLRADALYGLALPERRAAADAYRGTPCHIRDIFPD